MGDVGHAIADALGNSAAFQRGILHRDTPLGKPLVTKNSSDGRPLALSLQAAQPHNLAGPNGKTHVLQLSREGQPLHPQQFRAELHLAAVGVDVLNNAAHHHTDHALFVQLPPLQGAHQLAVLKYRYPVGQLHDLVQPVGNI